MGIRFVLVVILAFAMFSTPVLAAPRTLDTSPTEAAADTVVTIRYVGAGWTPNVGLVVGLQKVTSAYVGQVGPDGTFDVTFTAGPLPAGTYHPFAQTYSSDGFDSRMNVLHVR